MELTDSSQIINQPPSILKDLTRYQKAMLFKCLMIEKSNLGYGFMGDSPGVGKTAVLLSLLVSCKAANKKGQTIIVVPHNLLTQWVSEIEKFYGNSLKYTILSEYKNIVEFYRPDDVDYFKTLDLFITTSTLYQSVIDTMSSVKYTLISRTIFDEIDTIENIIENISLEEKRREKNSNIFDVKLETIKIPTMWYVSASISNLINENGDFILANTIIKKQDFEKYYVKCNPQFVEKYSLFKKSLEETDIHCESITDKYSALLSVDQLDYINSMSFNKVCGKRISKSSKNEQDTILVIIEEYYSTYKSNCENIIDLEKTIARNKLRGKDSTDLIKKLNKEKSDKEFYSILLEKLFKCEIELGSDISQNYKYFLREYKKRIETFDFTKSKPSVLETFIKNVPTNSKIIIFSDYTDGFNYVIDFFEKNEIKYQHLSGGNIKDIDAAIDSYKNKDAKFLLIDSALEGCGLNLENTTEIIFLHRTAESLKEQMIGRALRPGRVGTLHIKTFLNKNEVLN